MPSRRARISGVGLALLAAGLLIPAACTQRDARPAPASTVLLSPVSPSSSEPGASTRPGVAPSDLGCLVYADQLESDIWVLKGGSEPRRLARGKWPVVSPDGRYVAYTLGFPQELWIAGTDGRDERRLKAGSEDPTPSLDDLTWAPDGRMLVSGRQAPGKVVAQGPLWRIDVPAGTVRQLVSDAANDPLFSPDGNWLALASLSAGGSGAIGLIDAEGRGEPALLRDSVAGDRAWAVDSSGFMVAVNRVVQGSGDHYDLVWIPTTRTPVHLGRLDGVLDVSWQPGANRLVFRKSDLGESSPLYLANRDGSQARPIAGTEGMMARYGGPLMLSAWSPDGRWLAAMKQDGSLFLVDVAGQDVYPLDVQEFVGWLDTGHYAAVRVPAGSLDAYHGGDAAFHPDLYRCVPLGGCEYLTQVSRSPIVSYAVQCP